MNDSPGSTANKGSPFPKKCTVPRYSLIATVEIIEPATDTHFYGRVAEIGCKGCYVDILNTLPPGTFVQMMISLRFQPTRLSTVFVTNPFRMAPGTESRPWSE